MHGSPVEAVGGDVDELESDGVEAREGGRERSAVDMTIGIGPRLSIVLADDEGGVSVGRADRDVEGDGIAGVFAVALPECDAAARGA